MSNRQSRPRGEIIAILLALIIGASIFGEVALPALLILVGVGLLVWRQWGGDVDLGRYFSDRREEAGEFEEDYDDAPRQSGAGKVYAHALKAVESAGLSPDDVRVLPVDIGLMVFRADDDPIVYRAHPVPDDADYIQPFVQLRLPTKAVGRIKFELIDSDGQVLFVHEEFQHLERGRNLVTPSARLPVHDAQAMHKDWQLRISADGMILANHTFAWQESNTRRIRRHITEDGEISNELRATLAENRLQKLSLDELLSFQDADEEPRRQQRG